MKRKQTDFVYNLGIGAFAFLSILEFSDLTEIISRKLLIISMMESELTIWTPVIIGLIIYTTLMVWLVKKSNRLTEIDSRIVLIKVIGIFTGIIVITFLITFYGSEYLANKFTIEFDSFYNSYGENYYIIAYTKFSIVLKYLIFGILLLTRKKTVANKA